MSDSRPTAPVARAVSTVGRSESINGITASEAHEEAVGARDTSHGVTWSLLGGIVALSFLVRLATLQRHTTPRFFPDEYIYAAIGQSLGRGQLLVRDAPARFPALLEPLLAAPFWSFFSPETAYRLVQTQNALAMSLAAIPVFYIARRVGLSNRYSLLCAAFAVVLPDLVFSAYTIADPVAYPLVMAAVGAAVHALATGSSRAQLLFVSLAGLASFARVQYIALFVAFVAAAFLVERLAAIRKYRIVTIALSLGVVIAAAAGPSRLLGYYSGIADLGVNAGVARWLGLHAFLLTLVAGVVLIPGAVVAFARPRGRTQIVFSSFAAAFIAVLLLEAAFYAADGSPRFKERYVFMILPLVPIAFGLYLRNGKPYPRFVTLVALAIAAAAARLPLSAYSAADGATDSPFLAAVSQLDGKLGSASSSLVIAAVATLAAGASVLVAWRRVGASVAAVALVVAAVASFGSVKHDLRLNRVVERNLPTGKSWVDSHGFRTVTAIQAANSPPSDLLLQLYWNTSIRHEVVLPGGVPTDSYRAPLVQIAPNGSLAGASGPILFHDFGTTALFADARLVDRRRSFSLWQPRGPARLRLLITGRYWDGWLGQKGVIRVWPEQRRSPKVFSFQISLPTGASNSIRLRIEGRLHTLAPGDRQTIRLAVHARRSFAVAFSSDRVALRPDRRQVSVRMTDLQFST